MNLFGESLPVFILPIKLDTSGLLFYKNTAWIPADNREKNEWQNAKTIFMIAGNASVICIN